MQYHCWVIFPYTERRTILISTQLLKSKLNIVQLMRTVNKHWTTLL